MTGKLGYALVGGLRMAITRIHLAEGQIWFTAMEPGPRRARSGEVEIWAPDGTTVASGGHITTPAVPEGLFLKVEIRITTEVTRTSPGTIQGTVLAAQGEIEA